MAKDHFFRIFICAPFPYTNSITGEDNLIIGAGCALEFPVNSKCSTGTRSLIEVHWNSQLCKCFLPLEVKTQTLNFIGAWRIKKKLHRETSFCLFSSNLFQLKIKLIPLIIVFNSVNEYIYKTKSFRNLNELKTSKYVVTPPLQQNCNQNSSSKFVLGPPHFKLVKSETHTINV